MRTIAVAVERGLAYMPFFPNECGEVVSKAAVVATINEVVSKCSLPILDAVGRPLYGGHSLRIGGAVLLSSLGLDTTMCLCYYTTLGPLL